MGKKGRDPAFYQDCLADALVRLMEQDDLTSITVSEICAQAGVGRATYYRHFETKEDVLIYKFGRLHEQLFQEMGDQNRLTYSELIETYLAFIMKNRQFISLLYVTGHKDILENAFTKTLIFPPTSTYDAYKQHGAAYFFLGIIYYWIENDFTESPKKLRETMSRIIRNNLL